MTAEKLSDKFGIWREADGGLRLEFYRPNGVLTSRVLFDGEAAREFLSAVARVSCGCDPDLCDPGCDACYRDGADPFADCLAKRSA